MAVTLILVAALAGGWARAEAPREQSEPDDPDLDLAGVCPDGPAAEAIAAALPRAVPELVLLWPRIGHTRATPCRSVARVSVITHQGAWVTASFVLAAPSALRPEQGFVPWHGEQETAPRPGPPRNELVWHHPGGTGWLYVVLAGAPSASQESLEGVLGFIHAVDATEPLAALAGP